MNELKLAIALLIANDFEDAAMFLDGLTHEDLPAGEIEWSGQITPPWLPEDAMPECLQDQYMEENSARWDETGQLLIPAEAMMKPQEPEVLYTLRECKNGKNTEVRYNRVVWYVPTALLKARGLKLAALELKHTAQEGMKPRWDELLKIL